MIFWVISSTLFWAAYVIMVGIMVGRVQLPLLVATVQFMVSGLLGLVMGGLVEGPDLARFFEAAWGILYIGFF